MTRLIVSLILSLLAPLALVACGASTSLPAPDPTPKPSPFPSGFAYRLRWDGAPGDWMAAVTDAASAWNLATERLCFSWEAGRRSLFLGTTPGQLAINGKPYDGFAFRVEAGPYVLISEGVVPEHRRNVLTHELGHVLGLSHVADPGDVMHTPVSASAVISPEDSRRVRLALEPEAFRPPPVSPTP
jgi:hypothetical protein